MNKGVQWTRTPPPRSRSARAHGAARQALPSGKGAKWSSSSQSECRVPRRESFADQLVRQLLQRTGRRHASDAGLASRAATLADQYLGGMRPSSIRWSSRQQRRWGSCSLHSREIRIASRLQTVPEWVLDGVIVHELTHLLEAGHTERFHELANRYPRQSEAHTYLDGFGHGLTTAGFPVSAEEDQAPAEAANDGVAACLW